MVMGKNRAPYERVEHPRHDSRKPAGESGRCRLSHVPVDRRQRTGESAWLDGAHEKAGGRYTVGFSLRLPARFPVPSRSAPSLHRHS